MKILYLGLLVFSICLGIAVLGWIKKGAYREKNLRIIYAVLLAVLLPEVLVWWQCSATYREILLFLLVCCQLFLLLVVLYRKKQSRLIYFAAKVLFVVMVCEATIFNFPAFHLWMGGYEERTLPLSDAEIEGKGSWLLDQEKDELLILNEKEVMLYFPHIGQPVGTISADVQFGDKTFTVDMITDITDETHETFRYDAVQQRIYRFEPDSQIALCHLSGDVGVLRIKFTSDQEDAQYTVSNIRMNVPVAFSVSILRVFMLCLLPILVYALIHCRVFQSSLKENGWLFEGLSAGVYLTAVMLAALCIFPKISVQEPWEVFCKSTGDQMTQELVDAFEAGSVSLLFTPDERLAKLSNPYDRGLRDGSGIPYKWDHVYYDGKYYSYYGIAPVVLLFMPFHLLTGYYFSSNMAVLLFSVIGLWFLIRLYGTVMKKWFETLPMGVVFSGELVMVCACGIWYALSRPKFYEIAVSCAFMFLTMGVYFLLSSNIVGNGRISRLRLTASSVFLALSVLSRPTMAVYCICACLFYLAGFKKWRKENQKGAVSYWLSAMLPMVLLGLVQMAYNYARFDSIFEFGIGYSLTINDFTNVQYHTIYVLILLYNYLLAPVRLTTSYPFIGADFSRLNANGYFFKDTGTTPGLLFLALPVAAYLLAGKALKQLPREKRAGALTLIGLPCVVCPLITIFAAWNSGYAVRYFADFSWEIILGAILILFYLYRNCTDRTKRRFVTYFMAASAVCAIVVNAVQVYNFCFSQAAYPYLAYELEKIFAFWK